MTNDSKIILRNKRLSDASNDYEWQKDPELARLDATTPITCSFQEFLADYTDGLYYPSPHRRSFSLETQDGKHIGNGVYYNINEDGGETELGIMIGDRDYWDQGYGADTVKALIDFIFLETNLRRIYLKTLEANDRAQKCFQKGGFVHCGYMVRDGFHFVLMEIFRKHWAELKLQESQVGMNTEGATDDR